MSTEQQILERLERIETELVEARKAREGWEDLKHDIEPLTKQAFKILLKELGEVEAGFQLEDIFLLIKRFLRNIRNIAYALEQLETVIEMWHTAEPMLKSTMHQIIRYLGTLEQKGVFRTYEAMLEIRGKVAQHYGPEDLQEMGDGFVQLIGLLKKVTTPEMLALLDKLSDLPMQMKLEEAKPVGMFGLVGAMGDKEMQKSLGVVLQMTKALGKLQDPKGA